MSRYVIPSKSAEHEIVIGYDRPMDTYFAQVAKGKLEDLDFENEPVLWLGASRMEEITEIDDLRAAIKDYADIPPDISRKLAADRSQAQDMGMGF